jgi:uncharacterized protein (TIGR02145 family)
LVAGLAVAAVAAVLVGCGGGDDNPTGNNNNNNNNNNVNLTGQGVVWVLETGGIPVAGLYFTSDKVYICSPDPMGAANTWNATPDIEATVGTYNARELILLGQPHPYTVSADGKTITYGGEYKRTTGQTVNGLSSSGNGDGDGDVTSIVGEGVVWSLTEEGEEIGFHFIDGKMYVGSRDGSTWYMFEEGTYNETAKTLTNTDGEVMGYTLNGKSLVIDGDTFTRKTGQTIEILIDDGIEYGTLIDSRDNKTYVTVVIGSQTWMAENLNYYSGWGDSSWCYNGTSSNCIEYGRLYNWSEANTACPTGWKLPSFEDWQILFNYVGETPGTKLKAQEPYWDGTATDEYGFSALPGGFRETSAGSTSFMMLNNGGYWWTSTEAEPHEVLGLPMAYYVGMGHSNNNVFDSTRQQRWAHSVRCIQD